MYWRRGVKGTIILLGFHTTIMQSEMNVLLAAAQLIISREVAGMCTYARTAEQLSQRYRV